VPGENNKNQRSGLKRIGNLDGFDSCRIGHTNDLEEYLYPMVNHASVLWLRVNQPNVKLTGNSKQ